MRIPLHIKPDDFSSDATQKRAEFAYVMAQLNPRGVRTPPRHHKPNGGTSLAERRALEAGIIETVGNGISGRGAEKRKRRRAHIVKVKEQQAQERERRKRIARLFG